MLSVFRNMFKIRDLRAKIFFTLAVLALYRLGTSIPVPGVDLNAVGAFADSANDQGFLGLLNLFSGGALGRMSVFALGITPYITATIIMQLLTVVIPKLQALQEEGESGQKTITQWARYITVGLALVQSASFTQLLHRGSFGGIDLIPDFTLRNVVLVIVTWTAGTALIMWLGELITQRGVGNGMSLIIFISIVSQLPSQFGILKASSQAYQFWTIVALMAVLTVGIIFVDQGQRRIPIQFSRRVRGRKVLGGGSTYIPLKVNMAGVIPVIFATSVMYFPVLIGSTLPATGWGQTVRSWINDNLLQSGQGGLSPTLPYIAMLALLVVGFTYFYTAIQFDPVQQADRIQRQGGFIPGIRPGRATVRYLENVLSRITLPGSLYLAVVAVAPSLLGWLYHVPVGLSGVSILIVTGVALETMKQIESQLMMRNYDGFLA
ncbi:MAG: preprotein translocase subunit SecY [Acidobacteria bacterium]|nr:preprotein translocase subunit SecY [Acidobacteriota bacterium]MCH8985167.1 preprotein translocase subunit SecY [Acidobacteriota bacterium]